MPSRPIRHGLVNPNSTIDAATCAICSGEWVRELQTGQVQNYLLTGIALAAVLVAFYLFIFQG